jgi:CRP/FNR family transcriptional regulator, cyclic AMP receptor protein
MYDEEKHHLPANTEQSKPESSRSRCSLVAFMRGSAWAESLNAQTFERLLEATTVKNLRPGEVLCRQGDTPTQWYGIMRGLLRMDRLNEHGNTISLAASSMGAWFGEAMLILGDPRTYEVSSMRSSTVACINGSVFLAAMREDPQFNEAILRMVSSRVRFLADLLVQQRELDPQQQIARILVSMAGQPKHGFIPRVKVSQEELGQLVGVARQRVNQTLSELRARGLIKTSYASVALLDLPGLLAT